MTNTELLAALKAAKTTKEAAEAMRAMDRDYRERHAVEIKTAIAALQK